jgi:GrpB-like predicted nucleotidyltransferase (UPF0157 family)
MVRKIEVVSYNANWPKLFKAEAERIAVVLNQEVIAIHHIGSTAIPTIAAKPVIDILIEVHDVQRIDSFNREMIKLGFRPRREFGIPKRRFFAKGSESAPTHHLHVF